MSIVFDTLKKSFNNVSRFIKFFIKIVNDDGIGLALDIELSVLVDLNDLTESKNAVREQFQEMKIMFEEMKQFNAELDKMIADMDKVDSVVAV